MWQPDTGAKSQMRTTRPAPMAAVVPMSATPSFPPDRFTAMMPAPMITASRPAVPRNSATRRRASMRVPRGVR